MDWSQVKRLIMVCNLHVISNDGSSRIIDRNGDNYSEVVALVESYKNYHKTQCNNAGGGASAVKKRTKDDPSQAEAEYLEYLDYTYSASNVPFPEDMLISGGGPSSEQNDQQTWLPPKTTTKKKKKKKKKKEELTHEQSEVVPATAELTHEEAKERLAYLQSEMKQVKKRITETAQYECGECDTSFTTKFALTRHMAKKH
jgi:hypothetical protein